MLLILAISQNVLIETLKDTKHSN